jgi:anti-sigma regulatory factor (Ser/Thr protein kinase)
MVERFGARRLPTEIVDDLKLIATELVSNAYLHGVGRIWLKLSREDHRVRVEVVDEGHNAAVKVRPAPSDRGGRGLRIVEQLAAAWGAHEGTTHVWAELPLDC